MAVQGFSVGRNITVNTTGAFSLDGYKALMQKVQEFEDRVANGETLATIPNGSEIKVIVTSKTQYRIYIFDLDADFTAGTYNFDFLEEVPNVESATTL